MVELALPPMMSSLESTLLWSNSQCLSNCIWQFVAIVEGNFVVSPQNKAAEESNSRLVRTT